MTDLFPGNSSENQNDPDKNAMLSMPLVQHLIELRKRLLNTLIFFFLNFLICYLFSQNLFEFLVHPLAALVDHAQQRKMIYTGLPEAFITYIKVSVFFAFILTFPILSYQIWRFIIPGLYQSEKKVFKAVILLSPLLFLFGAAFAFYLVIPQAWAFFLSFERPAEVSHLAIQLEARVSEYLSMTLTMVVAFAFCFQLPLVLYALGSLGIVTKDRLIRVRKYSFVGILILSAALTPPDVLSMIGLALPLYFLYEISIFFVGRIKNDA